MIFEKCSASKPSADVTQAGRVQANTTPPTESTLLWDPAKWLPGGSMVMTGHLHHPGQRGIYHHTLLSSVVKPNKLLTWYTMVCHLLWVFCCYRFSEISTLLLPLLDNIWAVMIVTQYITVNESPLIYLLIVECSLSFVDFYTCTVCLSVCCYIPVCVCLCVLGQREVANLIVLTINIRRPEVGIIS